MAGYIIVDVKTKKTVAICMTIALFLFILGIVIGIASQSRSRDQNNDVTTTVGDAIRASCSANNIYKNGVGEIYFKRFLERHSEKYACVNSRDECMNFGLPRTYIAYHLNDKSITIDGSLDEEAWAEVPWTENLVDIRSEAYPLPYLDTKFKVRWDDTRMYLAAFVQENNLWATYDTQDFPLFRENALDILMDIDGSMFNYKQMQINVLGTMMDQMMNKSPYDSPDRNAVKDKTWHPDVRKAVGVDGTINDPTDEDKSWTVELSLSFKALAEDSTRSRAPNVNDNEVWFMQFGRSQHSLTVKNGKYEKTPNTTINWWAWNPCDAVNLLLQDRWGLVQFKRNRKDKTFSFPNWHIYKALFDAFNAMKVYEALHGRYVTDLQELDVPPYLLSRTCVEIPEIKVGKRRDSYGALINDFEVRVKSMLFHNETATIRSDRYVWFGNASYLKK